MHRKFEKRPRHRKSQAQLRAEIEAGMIKVADFMVNHGRVHLAPIYDRLEKELERLDEQEATIERARSLLRRD